MRVKVVLYPRQTEDWNKIQMVCFVNDFKECEDGLSEYLDYDVESVEVERDDGSMIEDLELEDIQYLMSQLDYEVLEAMIAEEYLSGVDYE